MKSWRSTFDSGRLYSSLERKNTLATGASGKPISRAIAEQRMLDKLSRSLTEDIAPLLPASIRFNDEDAIQAFEKVWRQLIVRMQGEAWKLTEEVLADLRTSKYPGLLER